MECDEQTQYTVYPQLDEFHRILPDRMNMLVICFVFEGQDNSEDIPIMTQLGLLDLM